MVTSTPVAAPVVAPEQILARRTLLTAWSASALAACAISPSQRHLQVNVASVERVPSEAMEVRLLIMLRLRNPNDASVSYSGASIDLYLQGKLVGSGVSNSQGSLPGYSETSLFIHVTVSGLGEIRRATGMYGGSDRKLDYSLRGKLHGSGFDDLGFEWQGELALHSLR